MEALKTASGLGFLPLLAIGLGLIALEGLLFSFFILWFGVG
ncbi:MAG: nodulation efficiency protein D, partial [Campylobacteraceae bacterium]|nr:nodulation efficiency protein D [Campylobacteraceae bacterium]